MPIRRSGPYTTTLVEGVRPTAPRSTPGSPPSLATGWTLPRTPRVDRNALRIAVFELDYLDVPPAVVVSEAVHLVEELSTDESPAFVNGVLGGVIAARAG